MTMRYNPEMNNPVASYRVSKQIQIVHVIARSFIPKQSQKKRLLRFARNDRGIPVASYRELQVKAAIKRTQEAGCDF
jgi:hypothetical protein